ncbi:polyphosphate kinase 1 [Croceivirga sp. JEA036]|uniref:polyphosphate kinase 1 n=1 Tax=Croceivirga sp. JEA036 TaxID=2721162 RepID=UPI001439AAD5|nr:polyphosphate kinase 1 [Croceivirga sp. JEA036]NJB35705.1 polyphosphate kinase 1 [Croceivirga sp. JEA036]
MKEMALKHRDHNWLFFNERVLLEAQCQDTPLLERLKFLAIFSSNLDEYFKVRISQLRQLKKVDKSLRKKLDLKGNKTLKSILELIAEQQTVFGKTLSAIVEELKTEQVFIHTDNTLSQNQLQFIDTYFDKEVAKHCEQIALDNPSKIKDGQLYFVCQNEDEKLHLLKIPSNEVGRFVSLPGEGHHYMFIDDVIRLKSASLSLMPVQQLYAIKLSRDAELYLDDDYTDMDLVDKIYQSLGQRKSGQPTRLLYDATMPTTLVSQLKELLQLGKVDMVKGGKYHNLSDFFSFPAPKDKPHLVYDQRPPLPHFALSSSNDIFKTIAEKDQIVHFPYQDFKVIEKFIQQAANDLKVTTIKMSLYRIAKESALTDALLTALKNGKKVLLFVEAQARFDEQNNIKWGRIFEEHGATVLYSVPNIKVHSKIALVERAVTEGPKRYVYIGTGNFNAKTAKIYSDHGLFTAHKKITKELAQVFQVLERTLIIPKSKRLMISPFNTRNKFLELIQQEIRFAKAGKTAKITAKMNSLEDRKMIKAIQDASEAGVSVRLIVRGFCRLVPKAEHELKPNEKPIYITSIIDRYLEHGRIYLFHNGGDEQMFIGSADWMTRNLDRRIEVLTPILDPTIFTELKDILTLQLNDTVKARVLDAEDNNHKVKSNRNNIRSQYAIYDYLKEKYHANS